MAVIEGSTSGALMGVGEMAGSPAHHNNRPIPSASFGHYRTSHRTVMVASQAANSRFFEIRNIHASNLIVVTNIRVEWIQTAAHTAAILSSLDLYRVTSFSAVDTTNTATPAFSKLRTSFGTPVEGTDFAIRGLTAAGNSAGMTGGTLTKDTNPLRQWGQWLLAAVPTGGPTPAVVAEWTPWVETGESPLTLAQNEGLIIENRVALGAAAGSAVSIDMAFAITSAY